MASANTTLQTVDDEGDYYDEDDEDYYDDDEANTVVDGEDASFSDIVTIYGGSDSEAETIDELYVMSDDDDFRVMESPPGGAEVDEPPTAMDIDGEDGCRETVSKVDADRSLSPNCPICFEPWTSEGPHRVCCIPCGHVYGKSCIEKWAQKCHENHVKCPLCNRKFIKTIINLYAPLIGVRDDNLDKELHSLREKNLLLKLEKERLVEELNQQKVHDSEADSSKERNTKSITESGDLNEAELLLKAMRSGKKFDRSLIKELTLEVLNEIFHRRNH